MEVGAAEGERRPVPSSETRTTAIDGPWTLSLELSAAEEEVIRLDPPLTSAFGPGRLVVEQVVSSKEGLAVTGHVEGLDPADFAAAEFQATLVVNGRAIDFIGGRSGFGNGNASFEFRFVPASGATADLTVAFRLGAGGPPERAAALAEFSGSQATAAIPLP